MNPYLALLLFAGIAVALIYGLVLVSHWLNPQRSTNPAKEEAYECGIIPKGDARARVSVHYLLMALLFLIFDIEVVFLYPWAVAYRQLKLFGFVEMMVFIAILLIGYFYAWGKGVLDWK